MQRSTFRNQFSFSTLWVLGLELSRLVRLGGQSPFPPSCLASGGPSLLTSSFRICRQSVCNSHHRRFCSYSKTLWNRWEMASFLFLCFETTNHELPVELRTTLSSVLLPLTLWCWDYKCESQMPGWEMCFLTVSSIISDAGNARLWAWVLNTQGLICEGLNPTSLPQEQDGLR